MRRIREPQDQTERDDYLDLLEVKPNIVHCLICNHVTYGPHATFTQTTPISPGRPFPRCCRKQNRCFWCGVNAAQFPPLPWSCSFCLTEHDTLERALILLEPHTFNPLTLTCVGKHAHHDPPS